MTLKTSFFNKGIYKSTIKRYLWGSVLYFLILFISTSLSLLMTSEYYLQNFRTSGYNYQETPLILRSDFIIIPILTAIIVPTITAILIFRFIHSKKSAIFTHSLPVTRTENYLSSLLAAFTLMFAPVILNTISLIIISLSMYGNFFSTGSCIIWMGINLFTLFIMFSCSVFASVITGNGFAVVILNGLIHSFLFILAGGFSVIAETFLCGFSHFNPLFETLVNNNFVCIAFSIANSNVFRENFIFSDYLWCIISAIIIYILALVLYKKRKLENAEDIAGFNCLNSIFKYLVAFLLTIGVFALFSYYISNQTSVFTLIVIIISITAYFGTEMLLKKTLNVWYSYKGYLCFAVLFTGMVLLFSQTSFFGYETYIPNIEDIESATAYTYYYDYEEPFTEDTELIELITGSHKDLITPDKIYKVTPHSYGTRIHIKYKLKNKKEVIRAYYVSNKTSEKIMNKLYEYDSYKMLCEEVYMDVKDIRNINIYGALAKTADDEPLYVNNDISDFEGFLKVLQADILSLTYSQLHPHFEEKENENLSVEIRYTVNNPEYKEKYENSSRGVYMTINSNFRQTVNWLKENKLLEANPEQQ